MKFIKSGIFKVLIPLFIGAGIISYPKKAENYATGTIDNPSIHPMLVDKLAEFQPSFAKYFAPSFVKEGTINEDSPDDGYVRSFNHFQHWQTGQGLTFLGETYPSVKEWILNGELQEDYPYGDQSWEALKKQEGNIINQATIFGHLFHLIADLTVPSHARLDKHPLSSYFLEEMTQGLWFSDLYEVYTDEHKDELINLVNPQKIPQFNSIGELVDSLAYFTGSNFYSDDTLDGTVNCYWEGKYCVRNIEGKKTKLLRKGFLRDFPDTQCLRDYWQILGTKSVEYGAALFELLKKEVPCQSPCQLGEKKCVSSSSLYICEEIYPGCNEWREEHCPEDYFCSDEEKKCILEQPSCDQCSPGDQTCVSSTSYKKCENISGCYQWKYYDCDEGYTCKSGICTKGEPPACQDECLDYGEKKCFGNGVKECGDFDSDPCLEWGDYKDCGAGEYCEDGYCYSCEDECKTIGEKLCFTGLIGWKKGVCGNYDSDPCLEVKITPCQPGEVCKDGECVKGTCGDECNFYGEKKCISDKTYFLCGNFDDDECLEWKVYECGPNEICKNGECISDTPTDKCSYKIVPVMIPNPQEECPGCEFINPFPLYKRCNECGTEYLGMCADKCSKDYECPTDKGFYCDGSSCSNSCWQVAGVCPPGFECKKFYFNGKLYDFTCQK